MSHNNSNKHRNCMVLLSIRKSAGAVGRTHLPRMVWMDWVEMHPGWHTKRRTESYRSNVSSQPSKRISEALAELLRNSAGSVRAKYFIEQPMLLTLLTATPLPIVRSRSIARHLPCSLTAVCVQPCYNASFEEIELSFATIL